MIQYGDTVPVSAVIPCFRCARTIERALEPVIQQTQVPAEIILVDDASDDDTLQVLLQFEREKPEWIKVVALGKNSGAASARNAGWAVATQPYIAFLDADDSWHPEKLRIQYDYVRLNPEVALCGHRCGFISDDGQPQILPKRTSTKVISSKSLLYRNAFSTPTAMLKSDIPFRFAVGKRYAEDVYLWQLVAFEGLKIVRIELPLAFIHKEAYGAGGLSADIWQMELAELDNFAMHYKQGRIGLLIFSSSALFSIAKYFKRVAVCLMRNSFKGRLNAG